MEEEIGGGGGVAERDHSYGKAFLSAGGNGRALGVQARIAVSIMQGLCLLAFWQPLASVVSCEAPPQALSSPVNSLQLYAPASLFGMKKNTRNKSSSVL